MRSGQLCRERTEEIRRRRHGTLTFLYVLSFAEENGHDDRMGKANPRAINESVSGAFYKGEVLGILGVFDKSLYG